MKNRNFRLYQARGEEAQETCELIEKISKVLDGINVPTVCAAIFHIIYDIHKKYGKDVLSLEDFLDDIKKAVLEINTQTEKYYLINDMSKKE